MNEFFELPDCVSMDSRLRGNDTDVPCDPDVIPAKAGIHLRVTKKSKELIHHHLQESSSVLREEKYVKTAESSLDLISESCLIIEKEKN